MFNHTLHSRLIKESKNYLSQNSGEDVLFFTRFAANLSAIDSLFRELYGQRPDLGKCLTALFNTIRDAHTNRTAALRKKDLLKAEEGNWFLSNKLAGMSLYIDRFAGKLPDVKDKLPYLKELGINVLHFMPIFESPANESDGGYAVSNFRQVDQRFGHLDDLVKLRKEMDKQGMYLMTDIVLNHTSRQHAWAKKAAKGDKKYQDYFYMFDDRSEPNEYEKTMKEIFPTAAPGNFTYVEECNKWVMTVFHNYQWDLNFSNPAVFMDMLSNIFFYANLGVDILRIDAPAFIWKQIGTPCTNLQHAHTLLRLIKLCVQVATPGMALLGEAIQAPRFIITYFGQDAYTARECDFCYDATQMATQWDALATGDTRVMLAAQSVILQKPFGTSWITYTRCHDDIGLGYDDGMINQAGFDPVKHRSYIKDYYSGKFPGSPAKGDLFSFNPKTGDARISGSLASLCGLETALAERNNASINKAIKKILLMQAMSFFVGGLPMIFYGDEVGYLNDYSYLKDPARDYDNRWMHRPVIDWRKNDKRLKKNSVESKIFHGTQKLLQIRKALSAITDFSNVTWITPFNIHVAGFIRHTAEQVIFCFFNFRDERSLVTWYAVRESGYAPELLYDHWREKEIRPGEDHEFLVFEPYDFYIFEVLRPGKSCTPIL